MTVNQHDPERKPESEALRVDTPAPDTPSSKGLLAINTMRPSDAALVYARAGFRVVLNHGIRGDGACTCRMKDECGSKAKHPIYAGWTKSATNDVSLLLIQETGQRGMPFNVGLLMGAESRLVAIDVDGPVGAATLQSKELELGPLPLTLAERTGGGGSHRILRVPIHQDLARLTSRANALGEGSKVDLRGNGSQIIVSPSLHRSGNRYAWSNEAPIANLPDAWYAALATAPAKPNPMLLRVAPTATTSRVRLHGVGIARRRTSPSWARFVERALPPRAPARSDLAFHLPDKGA